MLKICLIMNELKTQVRVCKNSVLQILTPNDPAQLQMFGTTKYSVKSLQYDKVWRSKGYIKVQESGKLGLFDRNGKQILPIKFDNILVYERGFLCTEGNRSSFYRLDGSSVFTSNVSVEKYFPKYGLFLVYFFDLINPLALMREKGGFVSIDCMEFDSYIDLPDKLLLRKGFNQKRLMFDKKTGAISWVWSKVYGVGESDADAIIYEIKKQYGLIFREGSNYREIIKPGCYERIYVGQLKEKQSFGRRLPYRIAVKRRGKTGVVDWNGKVLIPCLYDEIREYEDLGIIVYKNGKKGLFTHKKVLSCCYDEIFKSLYYKGEKHFIVCKNGLYGVVRDIGIDEEVVPIKYQAVYDNRGIGYEVVFAKKHGFYDLSGKQILMPLYDYISATVFWKTSKMFLKIGMKSGESTRVGITDFKGKIVVPIAYKNVELCGEEIIVQSEFGCGLFSAEGKKLLTDDYDSIEQITTSLYRVGHDGKYGAYFTKRRKMVVPIKYSWVDIDKAGNLFGQVPFMQIPM
ncbi:MAG: WG repeat-containing protein [Alphaproteobacteria bacterium]|nr:WG repeat-containing protein [Alphaproteobacteria bacterium]